VVVINSVKLLRYMGRKSPPSYAAIPKKKPPKYPPSQDSPLARMESKTINEDGDRDDIEQVREGEH